MGPQSRGGQKVQKQSHYKAIFQTPKKKLDVALLPLELKDDFKSLRWYFHSILDGSI